MSFLSVKKMDNKQAIYVFSFKISKKKKTPIILVHGVPKELR